MKNKFTGYLTTVLILGLTQQGCSTSNVKPPMSDGHSVTPNEATVFSTKPKYADSCGNIPYSIQLKDAGGEVSVKLLGAALDKINKEGINATLGAGMVQTAYSGMVQQAFGEVADYYGCLLQKEIDSNVPNTKKDNYQRSVQLGIGNLKTNFAIYTSAYVSALSSGKFERVDQLNSNIKGITTRTFPGIDPSVFDAATKWINLDDNFGIQSRWDTWAKATIAGINIGACGGFIMAALESNTGPIQHAVMSLPSTLRSILDETNSLSEFTALSNLFNQASTVTTVNPPSVPAGLSGSSFKGCSESLGTTIAATDNSGIGSGAPALNNSATPSTNPANGTPTPDNSSSP